MKFSIDPYSKNDLSVATDISIEPGDQLLRDRSYFSAEIIKELKEKGADTISRCKHKTTIYDKADGACRKLIIFWVSFLYTHPTLIFRVNYLLGDTL